MRATTQIHIAIRNIGDSQDTGDFYQGTVSESILWMATKISKMSMATRIVVGMGRNREDAARGIDVHGAGKAALNDDMKAMLESVFNSDEGAGADESETRIVDTAAKHSEDDDYVA